MKARFLFFAILTVIIMSYAAATASAEEMEEWSCGSLDFDMLASGPAGTPLSITGNDADPANAIQFLWDGSLIGTTTADSNGDFSIQFNVPVDATPGPHTVAFSGWDSQDVFLNCPGTFTVTGSSNPDVTPEQPPATGTDTPVTQTSSSQGSTGTTTSSTTTGSLPSTGPPLLPAAALALGGLAMAALGWRRS